MEKTIARRRFAVALGVLALAGCSLPSGPSPGAPAPTERREYRYDGVAGTSDVIHEKVGDGRERLRGSTDVARPGSPERIGARETASLDARGRLEHAEIIVGGRSAAVHYTLEPSRGAVRVERPGRAPVDWRVPNDAPWLYAPGSDGEGTFITTPVGAWVALRAARAAEVVRVLEPEQQRSYLVLVDQVAVATESGVTVALGGDGVDADSQFVSELRLLHGAVTLARVAALDGVPRT